MRTRALLFLSILAAPLSAQQLTRADSNLVYAILTAEDRRDSLAPALAEGMRHPDERIRVIAERAKGRSADSLFAARSTLPTPAPRITWPLPEWRVRLDSLRFQRDDCEAMRRAVRDSVVQVRLRALDLLRASCHSDTLLLKELAPFGTVFWGWRSEEWPGSRGWIQEGHTILAVSRVWPEVARRSGTAAGSAPTAGSQLRVYLAQAARLLADTASLRTLTRDRTGNVVEAAVDGLSAVAGHSEDSTYLRALRSNAPQAARAAAIALKGSTDPRVRPAAERALRHWNGRHHDSERDARLALLDLLGRPARDDIAWNPMRPLPREVIALALGRMDTLTVNLASGAHFLVRLRGDIAPITAARVLALVDRGDYREGSWHRVIPDFVIQGGLAGANEYVGGRDFFRDELGNLSHLRGGVGMSTRGHDTGDGQWFIDLSDLPRLDKDYTLFGEVIDGMDVVDGVLEGEAIRSISRVRRTR